MIYIIEGPHGSGKSYLFEAIRKAREEPCLFLTNSGLFKTYEQIEGQVDWLNSAPDGLTIFVDSHPLMSESIYGALMRGKSLIPTAKAHKVKPIGQATTAFIYCRPPDDVVRKNIFESLEHQVDGSQNKVPEILELYDQIFRAVSKKSLVLRYDYTKVRTKTFIAELFKGKSHLNG